MSILSDEGNLISKQPIQDDGLKSQYVSTNAGLLSCYYYLDVDMFNKNMGHVPDIVCYFLAMFGNGPRWLWE